MESNYKKFLEMYEKLKTDKLTLEQNIILMPMGSSERINFSLEYSALIIKINALYYEICKEEKKKINKK